MDIAVMPIWKAHGNIGLEYPSRTFNKYERKAVSICSILIVLLEGRYFCHPAKNTCLLQC